MKNQLRQDLRNKRIQLSGDSQTSMSSAIGLNVIRSTAFKEATKIGIYHSVKGEANPSSIKSPSKQFYLPVISKDESEGLVFIETNEDTQFIQNKFNIPEPKYDESKLVSGDALDLVIVPLLGFDHKGHRLGMGGGFYDRCFAFKKQQKSKPILMGFAYNFQQVKSLEAESWDVDLDMIATESKLIIINKY